MRIEVRPGWAVTLALPQSAPFLAFRVSEPLQPAARRQTNGTLIAPALTLRVLLPLPSVAAAPAGSTRTFRVSDCSPVLVTVCVALQVAGLTRKQPLAFASVSV